jgi:8-oxo-dGTP pyrophosphatase MutT (NUDIX family)
LSVAIHIDEIKTALAGHSPDTSHSESAKRNAAVAMIICEHPEHGLAALFIKRAEHPNDPWSGHMALPGGRHEPEDASFQHAAMRETLEEVGVTITEDMCIGRLHDLYGGRLKEHRMAVCAFVFHMAEVPVITPNYEVADTVWVPIEFMRHPENASDYRFHLDPETRDFPSFQYESYTIWGLTFRILANFYKVLGVEHPGDPEVTNVE